MDLSEQCYVCSLRVYKIYKIDGIIPNRMPFSVDNPSGFILSLIIQALGGYSFMCVMTSLDLLFMTFYIYTLAFMSDIQYLLDEIDRIVDSPCAHVMLKKLLIDIIRLQTNLIK